MATDSKDKQISEEREQFLYAQDRIRQKNGSTSILCFFWSVRHLLLYLVSFSLLPSISW